MKNNKKTIKREKFSLFLLTKLFKLIIVFLATTTKENEFPGEKDKKWLKNYYYLV